MVRTLVGSIVAAALVGTGVAAGRATTGGGGTPARCGPERCAGGRCEATVECREDGCIVRWTAADGRTGEIELTCRDGECRVERCTPCGDGGCR